MEKKWWRVTIFDGEYTHGIRIFAGSVTYEAFLHECGLQIDDNVMDFGIGNSIQEIIPEE